jgi:hypothetical protein
MDGMTVLIFQLIADCRLLIADCRLEETKLAETKGPRPKAKVPFDKSAIGNRQSAMSSFSPLHAVSKSLLNHFRVRFVPATEVVNRER